MLNKHSLLAVWAAVIGMGAMLSACSVVGVRDGYEEPAYQVIDRIGETVEIRRYAPRLAAEVTVPVSPGEDGGNSAFRLLFDYITGANAAADDIAMTTPVEMARQHTSAPSASDGQDIAMTVPVEMRRDSVRDSVDDRTTENADKNGQETMTMRFCLPAEFSSQNAPKPKNKQVSVVTLPEVTQAVLTYTGSRSLAAEEVQQEALLQMLERTNWQPTGTSRSYFYDPPWTLPFLRRNEVAIPVIHRGSVQGNQGRKTSDAGVFMFTPKREARIPPASDLSLYWLALLTRHQPS